MKQNLEDGRAISAFAQERLLDARISVARGAYVPGKAIPYALSEIARAVRGAASVFLAEDSVPVPPDRLEAMYPRSVFGPRQIAETYGRVPARPVCVPAMPFTYLEAYRPISADNPGRTALSAACPPRCSSAPTTTRSPRGTNRARRSSCSRGRGTTGAAGRWCSPHSRPSWVCPPRPTAARPSECATATELLWYLGLKAKTWKGLRDAGEHLPHEGAFGHFSMFARADGGLVRVSGSLEDLSKTEIVPAARASIAYGQRWKVLKLASR